MDAGLRRWTGLAGPVGIAVAFGAVLAATLVAPWFSWTGNALSDLGHPARATAPLFNGGLLVGGLLGAAFAVRLWSTATNALDRLGVVLLGLSLLDMAAIGLFPIDTALHGPVSVAFFLGFTYALFAAGTGDALAGRGRRAALTVWLAVGHVTGWLAWGVSGLSGVALPELVGAAALAAWVLVRYRDLGRTGLLQQ